MNNEIENPILNPAELDNQKIQKVMNKEKNSICISTYDDLKNFLNS